MGVSAKGDEGAYGWRCIDVPDSSNRTADLQALSIPKIPLPDEYESRLAI